MCYVAVVSHSSAEMKVRTYHSDSRIVVSNAVAICSATYDSSRVRDAGHMLAKTMARELKIFRLLMVALLALLCTRSCTQSVLGMSSRGAVLDRLSFPFYNLMRWWNICIWHVAYSILDTWQYLSCLSNWQVLSFTKHVSKVEWTVNSNL